MSSEFFLRFMYLFILLLAVLDLCYLSRAFSGCREWGQLFAALCRLLIAAACRGAWALGTWVSAAAMQGPTIVLCRLSCLEAYGIFLATAAAAKLLQSCPTLSDPMDCSPPGSSVHGIFQARVLEWGAIAFSEGTGIKSMSPTLAGGFLTTGPPGKPSSSEIFQNLLYTSRSK